MSSAEQDTHEHTNGVLTRQQFPSLPAFIYDHHWLSLLRAEEAASVIKIDEDLSPKEKRQRSWNLQGCAYVAHVPNPIRESCGFVGKIRPGTSSSHQDIAC